MSPPSNSETCPDGGTRRRVDSVDDITVRVIGVLEELLEATRAAGRALAVNEELIAQAIGTLRTGGQVADILHTEPVGEQRLTTQAALDRVNAARHQLRLSVIDACIQAGMTPRQIAEEWDMSRQRVDQFVQELKKASTD